MANECGSECPICAQCHHGCSCYYVEPKKYDPKAELVAMRKEDQKYNRASRRTH